MSAKLGTLTLDLIAKIGNFVEPIKKAEAQTKTSFEAMKKSVLNYGAIAVSGAAAVGAGVFAMANEYANAARELQTFASISNTTTQEFQKMSVGAETMGVSQEKLSDQLKDFNEKLGEFTTIGSGGAVDFFEQIAIKTEGSAEGARKLALEMQNLSGPKALQLYVDKLEEAGVTQQQMSFYLESMASDTTNLIPLLKNGGEGFKFWADAAERAGVIMDEHAIKKANELSVQMDLLNLQVKGAKNQFIQGLMPALVSVGDSLTGATTKTNLMSDAGATLGNVFMGVAAMGMGVYAVVKMLSNAIAGLAVDAVNAKKTVDLAAEGGTWADKLPGVKLGKALITGATIAQAPNSGVSMALEDNAKVVEDIGTSITGMFTKATSEAVAAMAEIRNNQQGVISGSDEWIKKQNEAAKATSGANKALQEQNRLLEQQKRDREQISKAYSTDFESINANEQEDLRRILGAGFTSADQAKFTDLAKMRFEGERAEYFKSLNLELNQYKWSEEKKLEYAYQQDREIAENDIRFSGVVKEAKLKFLDEQYVYQKREQEISQAKELLQAKQQWMTVGEYAQEYYALVREEILNTPSYSPEMKNVKIKEANIQQSIGQNAERENIWDDYKSMMGLEDSPYQQDMDLLAEARAQMLITEEEYQRDRLALQVGYSGEYLGALSGMFGAMLGESSSAYQALFFAQKSFYLAQAGMNVWKSASDAYANEPGTVWQKMGAAALATIESGSFLSLIEAATPMGMAHDGIDNIPKEGTWLLDKGERVVDSRTNADLKGMIAKGGSSGPQININVPAGYTAEQSRGADGAVTIDIVEKRIKQSWGNLSNPNSFESKQVQRNTTAGVKR